MAPGQAVVKSEGGRKRLIIDYRGLPYGPDVAQFSQAMKDVVEKLREVDADEVVLSEYYERIYNEEQTNWLKQVADLVSSLEADAVWSPSHLGKSTASKVLAPRHDAVLKILNMISSDPFKAYLSLVQELKNQMASLSALEGEDADDLKIYVGTLKFMRQKIEGIDLIQKMKNYLTQLGSIPEGRTAYHTFFESAIKPSFIGSRIFFTGTEGLELVDQYEVLGTKVYVYKHPDKVEMLYYINPPEYSLAPEKYFLLEKTKEVVAQHRPDTVEFMDITQARKYFRKVYVATIADLALKNNIELSVEEKEDLATIVARYTIGYGILEILLSDRRVTDVYIDSPLGVKPVYLVHGKYGQCQTNVIFSNEEARSIVSRFRALSGRPFDEAHPILDFDLEDLQTRIAVIGKPLALDGIAFALRLHKTTPWTLAQFVDNSMFSALNAGMFSFFVDAQASMLIVGSRGAGKCLEGDTLIQMADGCLVKIRDLVEKNLRRPTILEDGCYEDCQGVDVLSLTSDLKVRRATVEKVWRRLAPGSLLKIKLASGKHITTTPEHPFFLVKDGFVTQKRADELAAGESVAAPRFTPVCKPALDELEFSTWKNQAAFEDEYGIKYTGCLPSVQEDLESIQHVMELKEAAAQMNMSYPALLNLKSGTRKSISLGEMYSVARLSGRDVENYLQSATGVKSNNSAHVMPLGVLERSLDVDYGLFLGLLFGDGHVDATEVAFTNTKPALLEVFGRLTETLFGLKGRVKTKKNRSPDCLITSRMISRMLSRRFNLPLGKKAVLQRIPAELLSASNDVVAAFLRGYFDCDSSVSKAKCEIEFCTASPSIAQQVPLLLLRFGILSVLRPKRVNGKTYYRVFIRGESVKRYRDAIGYSCSEKSIRLERILEQAVFNTNIDVVPNAWALLEHTHRTYGLGKLSLDQNELGRTTLQRLSARLVGVNPADEKIRQMYNLAHSDLFWDRVVSIEKVTPSEPYVYDLTVEGTHSFVANGVIAHNTSMLQSLMLELPQNLRILVQEDTQELPIPALKRLGYSIQRLKTRPPLGGGTETEVSAEDALRTALRLGDSVLIVGEVRSGEAKALYEAMRVGAVGNVVMGTIHGESAYGIWDRVVNDLGVPTTSFKATDFCLVSAPIRFKGSLKRQRRVIELTEVLKHWDTDPGKEDGFQPWLAFNAEKDALDFFEDQVKENSEWLKKTRQMRGLTYEDIMSEITSRGITKQYLVDQKRKFDIPQLLEADYAVRAHNKYLLLSEKQREEIGGIDHKLLLAEWKKWVDDSLIKDLISLKKT